MCPPPYYYGKDRMSIGDKLYLVFCFLVLFTPLLVPILISIIGNFKESK